MLWCNRCSKTNFGEPNADQRTLQWTLLRRTHMACKSGKQSKLAAFFQRGPFAKREGPTNRGIWVNWLKVTANDGTWYYSFRTNPPNPQFQTIRQREKPLDCSAGSIIQLKPCWIPVPVIHRIQFEKENTSCKPKQSKNYLKDVREPLENTYPEGTVLYCNQPGCIRNVFLDREVLSKQTTRVFTCNKQREQQTQYGKVTWQCPGIKIPAEPVYVKYRCIDPNRQECIFTKIYLYVPGLDGWKHPVCPLESCQNEFGTPIELITQEAYNRNSSRFTAAAHTTDKQQTHVKPDKEIIYLSPVYDLRGWKEAVEPVSGNPYYWRTSDPKRITQWHKPTGTVLLECTNCKERKTVKIKRKTPISRFQCTKCENPDKLLYRVVPTSGRRRLDALIERFQRESERCIAS